MPRKKSDHENAAISAAKPPAAREKVLAGKETPNAGEFPVAGIGASAGGLKALEAFFKKVPEDAPLAFVVIQHLNPNQESVMPKILSGATSLPVAHAKDGEEIRLGRIYVKPPGKDIRIEKGRLHLSALESPDKVKLPVDLFLRSLAAELGERAIAVILSGAGSDGSLGVRNVHEAGGLVVVQEESQAEYDSMPRSAIDTGLVDFILPVEQMPAKLIDYLDHPLIVRSEPPKGLERRLEQTMHQILAAVRHKTGHDFFMYKKNTIRRRIGRRMAVHHIEEMEDYLHLLRQNPAEIKELFRDLMINVTNFFRDAPLFELLRQRILPDLIQKRETDDMLRMWVPGCATGEEPYSLAMVLAEAMSALNVHPKVKIFATDINPDAIEKAREAEYPDNITADVSQGRLKRFFTQKGEHYKIKNLIRDMVVFAEHDLTRDPPFSRLDLVSCRNLLIYIEPELQKKIIPLFHYSLRHRGILVLGTSEGIGEFDDLFATEDKKLKVFRRTDEDVHKYLDRLPPIHLEPDPGERKRTEKGADTPIPHRSQENGLPGILEETFSAYVPPGVLIDQHNQVVYFFGDTRPYLTQPAGRPSQDLFRLAVEEVRYTIVSGVERARRLGRTQEHLQVSRQGRPARLTFTFIPLQRQDGYIFISFETERDEETQQKGEINPRDGNARIQHLEQRLAATQQELQATIEELETSNEELKSANEELQANNEELQSTNEELESSKEELQSINEELETTNTELSRKNERLINADDDVKNLFAATDIGTIFIDENLKVKRFNPAATRVFNLIEHDVGRPLSDITSSFKEVGFIAHARDVIENLSRQELEVETLDGKWLSVRMLPYRSSSNVIEGVVITFSYITRLKQVELEAKENFFFLQALMATIRTPVLAVGEGMKVGFANPAFDRLFQLEPAKYQGRNFLDLLQSFGEEDHWKDILCSLTSGDPREGVHELEIRLPAKGKVKTRLRVRVIAPEPEKSRQVLLIFEDLAA